MSELLQFGVIPIDNTILNDLLSTYKSPKDKISSLEKVGDLVRLKRGMYVVSPNISGIFLSTELIANHIYGPSYVSMESALRYYGLIPESVYAVSSMTTKRSRQFDNSIARFDYTFCKEDYYSIGIRQIDMEGYSFLIASPEKALCDLIVKTPKLRPRFQKAMQLFLEEDLRLNMEAFYKMDVEIFKQCLAVSKKKPDINNLIKLLER